MAMLLADVSGSTARSEHMNPAEFSTLINRFYRTSIRLISEEDGLVEELAGDSVAAFWAAGFAGSAYVRRAVEVVQKPSRVMVREGTPVGLSVHSGVAYFAPRGCRKD
ncbi:MAG TPA: hypothetical protein VF784_05785 [Anaerolineales bacterium]